MKKIDKIINHYRPNLVLFSSDLESNDNPVISKKLLKRVIEAKTSSSEEEIKKLRDNSSVDLKKTQLLTDAINTHGKNALEAVYNNDKQYFKDNPNSVNLLEVIVKTDGSRPSYLIKNGTVDLSTATGGLWNNILVANKDILDHAISCVGRVDKLGTHVGSGFLIGQNLFVTNRHVLQKISSKTNSGQTVYDDASVDFGFEFQGITTSNRREVKGVLFDSGNFIDEKVIDHSKIDMAIIELSSLGNEIVPHLNFSSTMDELKLNSFMYTIGYPGNPGLAGLNAYGKILEELYSSTYGYKRLSPGETIVNNITTNQTISHDASTLGGNSGSVIISNNKLTSASAIHYGGTIKTPRENWGLLLGATLSVADKLSGRSLSEILDSNKVIVE